MLEKTAASLDHCGLQRVLPSATKPLRSTRKLHTAFWQHGAVASVELSQAWQSLMHGTLSRGENADGNDTQRGVNLTASSFLLDFLYPNGAVALMRRWASASDRSARYSFAPTSTRLYTSTTARYAPGENEARQPAAHDVSRSTEDGSTPFANPYESITSDVGHSPSTSTQHQNALQELLAANSADQADDLWRHYKALGADLALQYTSRVMEFLANTGRLADSWKVSELFHQIEAAEWDDRIFVAGASAELKLQNTQHGLDIFRRGIDNDRLGDASLVHVLDLLLDVSLRSSDPAILVSLWSSYPRFAARLDLNEVTSQLKLVGVVPGLAEMALNLENSLRSVIPDLDFSSGKDHGFGILQRMLVKSAVTTCASNLVLPLLESTKDPAAFEEFLKRSTERRQYRLATEVYDIYRTLPGSTPSRMVMYEAFKGYANLSASHNTKTAGMDQLWADWHTFHERPSQRAYQRFLAYFADLGDKARVHQMWIDYVQIYADADVLTSGSDTFAHLLHVHAVLGEAGEVQRIFDDMRDKFKMRPNLHCWNILLHGYASTGDYDKTSEIFELLSAEHRPDRYSYGTMMQMAGSRGDLGYTADLYRKARSQGLRADAAILGSLVEAYCQNDMWSEAQDVCVRAAKLGTLATRIWNKLLYYHALRRDLAKVNELLQVMANHGVPYNNYTYQQLLLALSLCRQADHALHMLVIGLKDHIFEVTTDHFYIVMGAFVRTGDTPQVLRLSKLMEEYGFHKSSKIAFRLAEALAQWRLTPTHARSKRIEESLLNALQAFRHIYEPVPPSPSTNDGHFHRSTVPSRITERGLITSGSVENQFGTLSYLLGQLRDFAAGKDLVRLYQLVFGEYNGEKHLLPVPLLNSVMAGNLAEGNHEGVSTTWNLLFRNARKKLRSKDFADPADPNRISPRYQYILCTGLKVLLESMLVREDGAGMQEVVQRVLADGFFLDSKTWNYYVQALVKLNQYRPAFDACEQMLMPGWRGWFRARAREPMPNQLSLDIRRKGSSPRHLRPVTTTLYRLARGYMELDKMAPWSQPAAKLLEEIETSCPMTMRAIRSILRVHSPLEYEIFGEDGFAADQMSGEEGTFQESGEDELDKQDESEQWNAPGAQEDDVHQDVRP
ncbi:uncharacterized protein B0I36DRAFT_288942 [Microdochium trichocladiopsis]|uniref:Uncharacterized protein n=1 Tax=Microdochium trichocladiopsis TaxID=1682393 RepID=A0A9P8Y4M4_9PEZI|nr:uncharacterized protein B0I36DRAFT_288942 [Microdochium trichocladiopsis]KAH7031102.1 hypothetical protein B0I36DRAFT_288942 [Microdochium trichocladiopsis]